MFWEFIKGGEINKLKNWKQSFKNIFTVKDIYRYTDIRQIIIFNIALHPVLSVTTFQLLQWYLKCAKLLIVTVS